ncbi:hypothetical protein C8R43DRAFT_960089 [Mycena crocata]|nr:hypothetical protein C8R43DRAFT_960089 [Mycena crocata]
MLSVDVVNSQLRKVPIYPLQMQNGFRARRRTRTYGGGSTIFCPSYLPRFFITHYPRASAPVVHKRWAAFEAENNFAAGSAFHVGIADSSRNVFRYFAPHLDGHIAIAISTSLSNAACAVLGSSAQYQYLYLESRNHYSQCQPATTCQFGGRENVYGSARSIASGSLGGLVPVKVDREQAGGRRESNPIAAAWKNLGLSGRWESNPLAAELSNEAQPCSRTTSAVPKLCRRKKDRMADASSISVVKFEKHHSLRLYAGTKKWTAWPKHSALCHLPSEKKKKMDERSVSGRRESNPAAADCRVGGDWIEHSRAPCTASAVNVLFAAIEPRTVWWDAEVILTDLRQDEKPPGPISQADVGSRTQQLLKIF